MERRRATAESRRKYVAMAHDYNLSQQQMAASAAAGQQSAIVSYGLFHQKLMLKNKIEKNKRQGSGF